MDSDDLVMERGEGTKQSIYHLICWWATSLAVFAVCYAVLRPDVCTDDEACVAIDEGISNACNRYVCVGLGTLLLHESVGLIMHYRSAETIMKTLKGLYSTFTPGLLICTTFLVLLVHNLIFALSATPWYAHAAADGARLEASAPIYTNLYIEWLINVPLLLVIAGKCALYRPLRQLTRPVLITNFYITTAWSANFIANESVRWSVISVTFAMYAFASWEMAQWVREYLRLAPPNLPSRKFRPWLTLGLVIVFGLYGIIYLLVFTGNMATLHEKWAFMFCDTGSKIIMSLAFAGIQGSEYHDRLVELLAQSNLPFIRQKNLVSDVCPHYERLISR